MATQLGDVDAWWVDPCGVVMCESPLLAPAWVCAYECCLHNKSAVAVVVEVHDGEVDVLHLAVANAPRAHGAIRARASMAN